MASQESVMWSRHHGTRWLCVIRCENFKLCFGSWVRCSYAKGLSSFFATFFSHRIILCLDRASTSVSVCGFFYRQWIPGMYDYMYHFEVPKRLFYFEATNAFAWKLTSYNALKGWLAWTIEKAMNLVETFLWSFYAIELVIVWYNSNIAWIK